MIARGLAACLLALAIPAAQAGTDPAADHLFESQQWDAAPPGTGLTYRFERKTSDEATYGPAFEDRIRLRVEAGSKPEQRTVAVEMFSGTHRLPAGPFEDVSTNPVLVLFLERHVQELSRLLGGNPRYFKNAIRAALRDRADIREAEATADGKAVPARRVSIEPFIDDKNKFRMKGLETLTYTFVVSDRVPGRIVEIHARAAIGNGAVGLEEDLSYEPKSNSAARRRPVPSARAGRAGRARGGSRQRLSHDRAGGLRSRLHGREWSNARGIGPLLVLHRHDGVDPAL